MTSKERIKHLLRLFADNAATGEDIKEMLSLLRQDADDKELESFIRELQHETKNDDLNILVDWEKMWASLHPPAPVKKMHWWRVAAAVIIMLGVGSYLWFNQSKKETLGEMAKSDAVQAPSKDIQPGGNKAVLTLADGSQIVLDSTSNGRLAMQGNSEVIKLSNGQLAYKGAGGSEGEVLYNTMSTPRGGQYSLVLPDGSKVWLNAISSIRYPTFFKGGERTVEITGEAYLEVAKDRLHPFKVFIRSASGKEIMQVEVLGTHFNINAYDDESASSVTLLEGSVAIAKPGSEPETITPGQQALIEENITVNKDADIEAVMAWKNGRFLFRKANIQTIMRQAARWYDIEVNYSGKIPADILSGGLSKNVKLSEFLKILEYSEINATIHDKILDIKPAGPGT